MLLTALSFKRFHKHKGYCLITEFFALKWYIFVALTNKKLLVLSKCRLKQNSLFVLVKSIEGFHFVVIVAPSDPSKTFWWTKNYDIFVLLSTCIDELFSTPKIIAFLSQSEFLEMKKWTIVKSSIISSIRLVIWISNFS